MKATITITIHRVIRAKSNRKPSPKTSTGWQPQDEKEAKKVFMEGMDMVSRREPSTPEFRERLEASYEYLRECARKQPKVWTAKSYRKWISNR